MNKLFRFIADYWLIVFALYATGSIFFISFHYSTAITLLFIAALASFLVSRNRSSYLYANQLLTAIVLVIFVLLVWFINSVTQFSAYIAIILQILAAWLITMHISLKDFIRRYVNIMVFLAAVSLVCFAVYLVYPQIALYFPRTPGQASTDYYNAIIYVFESSRGFGYFVPFYRNVGIFWEPGAYQAFLNLALWFVFALDEKNKHKLLKICILALTIITTYSTTGYIVMLLIFLSNFKQVRQILSKRAMLSLVLIFILAILLAFINSNGIGFDFMGDKLSNEFGENATFLNRLFLDDLTIILESPINFFGISYEEYEARGLGSGNSIVQTMVTIGVPFTAILLWMYFRFSLKFKKSFLLFIILMMIFSTESLIWRPIFLCLAWYGLNFEIKEGSLENPLSQKG